MKKKETTTLFFSRQKEMATKEKRTSIAQQPPLSSIETDVIGSSEIEQRLYASLEKESHPLQDEAQEEEAAVDNIELELEQYLQREKMQTYNTKLDEYAQTIQQGRCGLCRLEIKGRAFTTMECGIHIFHNTCAHHFICDTITMDCILCTPTRRVPPKIFSAVRNLDDSVRSNPINFGDQLFVEEQVEARSILFQSLGAYTINFSMGSIVSNLTVDQDHDSIPPPTVAVVQRVLGFVKDAFDVDHAVRVEQDRTLDSNGNPLDLIRKRTLSVAQLALRGVTPSSLLFYKVSIAEFFRNDYTVEHLAILGIAKSQLFALGFDWNVWKECRKKISIVQLVNFYRFDSLTVLTHVCNNSVRNMAEIGLSYEDHQLLGTDFTLLFTYSGFNFETLKMFHLDLRQFRLMRLMATHLIKAGVSLKRIRETFKIEEDQFRKIYEMSFADYDASYKRFYSK